MKTAPWWNEARTPIAFMVAPLAVPLLFVLYFHLPPSDFITELAIVLSTGVAYLVTLALGFPLYLFLRARNITAFVVAPAFGLVAGLIVTAVLAGRFMVPEILQFGALSGAAVGAVLWLIARPDLPVQSGEGGSNDGATSP